MSSQYPYRRSGSSFAVRPAQSRAPHHALARKLGIASGVAAVLLVIFAVVAGLVFWFWQYNYGSEHNVTFKINQVTNIATGSGSTSSHEYDVYTGQGRVLMNSDTILHGKTDSANVQAWLTAHQGQVVECPVYGYRVFVLSSKMNILDGCKVVPANTPQNY